MEHPEIDLSPREWKSDREKPREPMFGPGAPGAIAYLVTFVIVFTLSTMVRNSWTKPEPTSLPVGHYTWSPEKGLQPR